MAMLALFSACILAIYACIAHGNQPRQLASLNPKLESNRFASALASSPWLAPVPGSCPQVMYHNMLPCLDYLVVGSKIQKPPPICCDGLEALLRTNTDCVCEAIQKSDGIGFPLNLKRIIKLPFSCKSTTPIPKIKCEFQLPPASSPDTPPTPPSAISGSNIMAPLPAPSRSGAATLSISSDLCLVLVLSILFSALKA